MPRKKMMTVLIPAIRREFHRGYRSIVTPRAYPKTVNAPGRRAFSRCAASFFLEIRQYSCEKMSCSARKFLAAGHIASFQIHLSPNFFYYSAKFVRCKIRNRRVRFAPAKFDFLLFADRREADRFE